jgi:hypothetical protein
MVVQEVHNQRAQSSALAAPFIDSTLIQGDAYGLVLEVLEEETNRRGELVLPNATKRC